MKTFEFVLARNRKKLITMIPILFISFGLLFSASSTAEARSNKGDIQREIEGAPEDGWIVAWGKEIDHWEYAILTAKLAEAYLTSNPWVLYDYFTDLLYEMIKELGTDVVLKAIGNPGSLFTEGELEVQGGIATYDHWHDENPCSIVKKDCWIEVDEPNTHQPYVRWRRIAGVPPPDEPSDPTSTELPAPTDPSTPEETTNSSEDTATKKKAVLMLFHQYLLKGF